jgi:molybdate transport system permease protein
MTLALTCLLGCLLAGAFFGVGSAWADSLIVTDASGNQVSASKASISGDGNVAISKDGDVALLNGATFGISSFTRQNKGTNRDVDDVYYGYRYRTVGEMSFGVVVNSSYVLVYIPQEVLDELGLDLNDKNFQQKFLVTLVKIDKAASNGGHTIEEAAASAKVFFTSSKSLVVGDYTYAFQQEIGGDAWYTTINKSGSHDASDGALYASSGLLTPKDDTVVTEKSTGMAALREFFENLDWAPLWVSLRTTGVAIVVIFILGLLAAWLTLRVSNKVKGLLDTIFTIPMVLPPTVCGFLLLVFFGSSSATGKWFISMGLDIVFTWPAAVIACIVVGFPMMYRTVRGAFENIDANMLDAARTLGWGEGKIFLRIMMPLAWPSIAAGTVLAFARAMGEFGCTLFFAGNTAGITQTIPLAIYFDWMGGKTDVAIFWVIVVILISFLVILFINIYSSKTQKYRKRLGE